MNELLALRLACELARRGRGDVEPNPPVGAVVLAGGEVVGTGWHGAFGGPHAEIVALAAAGERARGATLVVSLEPCSTTGKTGPCTEALLAAGVQRVVVGAIDPAPAHGGAGLARLAAAGVSVAGPEDLVAVGGACGSGIGDGAGSAVGHGSGGGHAVGATAVDAAAWSAVRREAEGLLVRFRRSLGARRPHVFGKWAMSRDGAIAAPGGAPVALTGERARERVHAWRAAADAIVVGVGTVLADDPLLTARGAGTVYRPLRRVVLDPGLGTPVTSQLVMTAGETPTWIVAAEPVDRARVAALEAHGARVLRLPAGPRWLPDALALLHLEGVRRVLVEGGATTHTRLLAAGLVDHLAIFIAPRQLGPGAVPALTDRSLAGCSPAGLAASLELDDVSIEPVGDDLLVRGFRGEGPGGAPRRE